ncbi:unnamed protein product [Blepharisma stoltei]|uniref:Phosphodiesterase n=1 Tax=Blepharisma stoltei TaxID=1481888 RepID=A0AAU9J4U3_9CILI|nr:unnamed protein product [Blepharisma stoltei]
MQQNHESAFNSFSYSQINSSAGILDALLKFSNILSDLLRIENLSIETLKGKIIYICRILTGASWVEVLLKEDHYLLASGKAQPVSKLEIDESSFPGYCALHKTRQALYNLNSSSFYTSFDFKLYPFTANGTQQVPASSVACIPIVKNGEVNIVLVLFNKIDENNSISYFTENDMNIIQAIGEMMLGLLDIINHCKELETKSFNQKKLAEENTNITNCTHKMMIRRKLLSKCIEIITEENVITQPILKLIGEVMESDGLIVHLLEKSNSLTPIVVSGLSDIAFSTKTSEYVALVIKEILNVNDLAAEPLWDKDKKLKMRSLLACPIFDKNNEVVAVIEFFRKHKPFSSSDERIAKELLKAIEKVHPERFIGRSNPNLSKVQERAINSKLKDIRIFRFNQDDFFNFANILEEIRTSLRQLVSHEESNIYIADQKWGCLWTKQSEECDTLTQLMEQDTLLGYVYHIQKPVILPNNDIQLSDSARFHNQFVICAPIISDISEYPVIGILLLTRNHKAFTASEIWILNIFCTKIAKNFENIYIYSSESKAIISEMPPSPDLSPTENFRRMNSKSYIKLRQEYAQDFSSPTETPEAPHNMNDLYSFSHLPPNKINELKILLSSIQSNPGNSLSTLAHGLQKIIPSQGSKLLLFDQTEQYLVDAISGSLMKPSGLINQCLEKRLPIILKSDAWANKCFDDHIDCLGIEDEIDSFLAVPVQSIMDHPLGVLAFVNASTSFEEEDIATAKFLSLITREFAMAKDESLKNYQSVVKMGRKHKMLQQWCKQVFFVANSAQNKMTIAKDILHSLFEEEKIDSLIKYALEIICALTNAEEAGVVYKEGNTFVERLLVKGKYKKSTAIEEEAWVMKSLDIRRTISLNTHINRENMIIVPYLQEQCETVIVKVWNKKDDTLSYYCNFSKDDEIIIYSFADAISEALNIFNDESKIDSLMKLKQLIRDHASNLNTYSFMSTIRCALKKLLDCDRASIFVREGKNMVIRAQGLDLGIPVGLSIPIGKGIIGNVAQTAKIENIKDVYEDPRFNPEVDRSTGYKTSTMLCMPVLDPKGKVIAAVQMINKRQGFFDKSDEQTLEIFCEIISTVLENWDIFQHQIEERSRFLNVFNSIGNYILVLDKDGTLEYCNKALENLFGVPEKIAKKSHYSSWLRDNRQLVHDITGVYQKFSKRIYRSSQKIASVLKKKVNNPSPEPQNLIMNYTIIELQDFFNLNSFGVILIFEDATAIEELNSKFMKIQNELSALKNSVNSETSLQRCIQKLTFIASENDTDNETSNQIFEIVKVLKEGNLNRAVVSFPEDLETLRAEVKQGLKAYVGLEENNNENVRLSVPVSHQRRKYSGILTVDIEMLRNIDINVFEIEDHFQFVYGMYQDFDLINQFDIPQDKLENFVRDVKEHYEIYINPFHNFYHGLNVLHSIYFLLSSTSGASFFGPLEIFSFFTAALCHDIEHPGRTNAFEMNRESHLSVIYNDKSVLENHHAATAFRLLQIEKNNIIQSLAPDFRKRFRKVVIVSILGTDMAKHFPMISNMTARFKDIHENPLGSRDSDLDDVAEFLLHCSDLAHQCKKAEVYQMWSQKLADEFTRQYEEELRLGMPPTEIFKDLDKPEVYYSNELGFLKFMIKPLWECANLWLSPHIDKMIENMNNNIEFYQKKKEEHTKNK